MLSCNNYFVVIPAGGCGQRFSQEHPKQYKKINDLTILEHTLLIFLSDKRVKKLILCLQENDTFFLKSHLANHPKLHRTTAGGTRAESVYNGLVFLSKMAKPEDWVIVHDAVRPCLHPMDLNKLIEVVSDHPVGGILAQPISDTIKKTNRDNQIEQTVDRSFLWGAQTPQVFRLQMLTQALEFCFNKGIEPTDEASALEELSCCPIVVQAKYPNPKLTTLNDWAVIEYLLCSHKEKKLCSE